MTCSVIVVLHDSAAPLPALLDSLARHLPAGQVVVVDTDSRDEGPALARAAGAEVVELHANPGFGAACNAGVARARHPVSVLLNPDCELLDSGLAELAVAAARTGALWAPRLLSPDGTRQRSAHPLPGTAGALLGAALHAPPMPRAVRERLEPWRAERPRPVGWAIAACLAARTGVLRRLGPFDAGHFLFYEDMDLCLRARAAGIPTIFEPRIRVRHLGAHATGPAYGGEPFALLAARRRAVVRANRGATAATLDDAAQTLTFASRAAAHAVAGGDWRRPLAQLAAMAGARKPDAVAVDHHRDVECRAHGERAGGAGTTRATTGPDDRQPTDTGAHPPEPTTAGPATAADAEAAR